jgi:hypothetical protein
MNVLPSVVMSNELTTMMLEISDLSSRIQNVMLSRANQFSSYHSYKRSDDSHFTPSTLRVDIHTYTVSLVEDPTTVLFLQQSVKLTSSSISAGRAECVTSPTLLFALLLIVSHNYQE